MTGASADHQLALAVGGVGGVGPGIAGYTAWIVAAVVVVALAALAWWTMRPATRATRADGRGRRTTGTDRRQPTDSRPQCTRGSSGGGGQPQL